MRVVSKDISRPEMIANQLRRMFLLTERDPVVETREVRVLVVEITRIQPRNVIMRRIEIKETRKVVPIGVEDQLPRRHVVTHPACARFVVLVSLTLLDL